MSDQQPSQLTLLRDNTSENGNNSKNIQAADRSQISGGSFGEKVKTCSSFTVCQNKSTEKVNYLFGSAN